MTKFRPIEEAPKDGTMVMLQFVSGLLVENRRAYWTDGFGWMYEASRSEWETESEFRLAPYGWLCQWWRPLEFEEQP